MQFPRYRAVPALLHAEIFYFQLIPYILHSILGPTLGAISTKSRCPCAVPPPEGCEDLRDGTEDRLKTIVQKFCRGDLLARLKVTQQINANV